MATAPSAPVGSSSHDADRSHTSDTLTLPAPFFRVRLINIDHVLAPPGPLDRAESAFNAPGQPLRRVPVLRIFGATPAGQRVCAHIHGVFPYCYVPYKGSLEPSKVLSYIHRLGRELNTAIAASLRRNPTDVDKAQFLSAIHLCKGVPFYGYHVGWRYFLKISFVDPGQNVRIATILQSGKVMGTKLQPYEVHIRYNLQFMLDFNLFGCDFVDFEHVLFRTPVPVADPFRSQDSTENDEHRKQWTSANIPLQLIQAEQVVRNSYCEIEIDCHCIDILNRLKLQARNQHNTFDERLGKRAGQQKLVPSLTGLWEEEQIRRINAGLSPSIPSPDTAGDARHFGTDQAPRWLATDRHNSLLQRRLQNERKHIKHEERFPGAFTKTAPLDHHIVTTFDSVLLLHGVEKHGARPERASALDFEQTPTSLGKGGSVYDLERKLSQNAFGSNGSSAPSHNGSDRPIGTLSSSMSKSPPEDDFEGNETVRETDLAFFSSQAFQSQMRDAEKEIHRAEKGDGDSDSDDEEAKPLEAREDGQRQAGEGHTRSSAEEKRTPALPFFPSSQPSDRTGPPAKRKRARQGTESNASDGMPPSRVRFEGDKSFEHGFSAMNANAKRSRNATLWTYESRAPMRAEVTDSFTFFGLPIVEHRDPYFSNPADVPRAREYAGRMFAFTSVTLPHLPAFEEGSGREEVSGRHVRKWEYGRLPPARAEVQDWIRVDMARSSQEARQRRNRFLSQRPAVTQAPSYGFKLSQRDQTSLVQRGKQHMTIFALEILTCTRGALHPDPAKDAVQAITYSFQHEDETLDDTGSRPGLRTGLIVARDIDTEDPAHRFDPGRLGIAHLAVEVVESELDMFNALIDLVRLFDPEIIVGYEIHSSSWGYLVERAALQFDYDLTTELGRVNSFSTGSRDDRWGATQYSSLRFTGRHTLNIWRLMRGELALNVYSYENVVFHLLRRRVPKYDFATLTRWYTSNVPSQINRALLYWVERVETDLELIEASELVFRTAEFARIYGIDFFSVISRGSQFKVESVMFRIAKPESFVLPSPSQQQVGIQNAAEDLPLVMEPLSAFYKGPVVVLDFQSLYPSVMIAYNICYSTCLGRVSKFRDSWKLGYTSHDLPRGLLSLIEEDCFIAPNGILYAKSCVRQSLLAKMLTEILDTRVMVKASVKGNKHDRAFVRLQNARQLSLKLLANVTYGYTSATFSGRMPCVEIADSIVRYGRETLENAITKIHSVSQWGAQVVYGDTDSLFIYLENRTREEAFRIGNEIADTITAANPRPIKLKFEKVYLPSVLLAKKRYVGFMYETPSDLVPAFNAKGIETVRRDGFPAQQRMVEACIRILFRTQDLSLVKAYCQRQWLKILQGQVSLQDFVFAKEVKLGSYSENGLPPPGAALAAKRMLIDKRSQCQYGERVPYVISQGAGKARLVDLARDPLTMLHDRRQTINAIYYITRGLIPPLSRIFNLLGADVESWFRELPKANSTLYSLAALMRDRQAANETRSAPLAGLGLGGGRLLDHYRADVCLVCRSVSEHDICLDCRQTQASTSFSLQKDLRAHQQRALTLDRICASCAESNCPGEETPCVNIDCPLLYERFRARDELAARQALTSEWDRLLSDLPSPLQW